MLRLYVAHTTGRTHEAAVTITKLCEEHLGEGNYDLEIVDIAAQPEEAKEANIIAVPTLIKKFPPPLRRFIGDMTKTERILIGLNVRPV